MIIITLLIKSFFTKSFQNILSRTTIRTLERNTKEMHG